MQLGCNKCGSMSLRTEIHGEHTGLYCNNCGAWIKWLAKKDVAQFEKSSRDINNASVIQVLEALVDKIDGKIDYEFSNMPTSQGDSIRKNAYCFALEQIKVEILSIISNAR